MRRSQIISGLLIVAGLLISGCGGSGETTTISGDELDQYVENNADEIAENARIEAEEEAEEEAEDDE